MQVDTEDKANPQRLIGDGGPVVRPDVRTKAWEMQGNFPGQNCCPSYQGSGDDHLDTRIRCGWLGSV